MAEVATLAAVGLAAVLAWAGVAKWLAPDLTTASFAALGLPWPSALARAVPAVELAVAVALVAAPRLGGIAALVMLAGFTALLAQKLVQGTTAACACFGQAHARPLSAVELVRNAGLMLLAALALGTPVPVMPGAGLLAVVALIAVALGTAGWFRRNPERHEVQAKRGPASR